MIMKIAIIDSVFGGIDQNREKTLAHIKYWLSIKDCKIFINTSPDGLKFYKENFGDNVEICLIPFASKLKNNTKIAIAIEYIKRCVGSVFFVPISSADIAYSVTSHLSDILILNNYRILGIKTFATFDNFVPSPSYRPGNYLWNLLAFVAFKVTLTKLSKVNCVLAYLTENNYQQLIAILDTKKILIERFDNGLNLDLIRNADSLSVSYDLLFLGRIHQAKGIYDFIRVVSRLQESRKGLKVAIAGSGDIKTTKDLIDLIKIQSLEQVIDLFGFVSTSKKYSLMKSAKFFVAPSYDDSYPVSIIEAYISGCEIFSYDLPIFKMEPFSQFNISVCDLGNVENMCNLVVSKANSTYKRNESNHDLVTTYVKNAQREAGLFRRFI